MGSLIKGITVKLYEPIQTGLDPFKQPIFEEVPVEVHNVLACPTGTDGLVGENQLNGKRAEYELCIPKKDTHTWQDKRVEFYGQMWKTIGYPEQWIERNLPLDWNLRVKVERYG